MSPTFTAMDRCVAAAGYGLNPGDRRFQRELRADHNLTGKQARKAAKAARRAVRSVKDALRSVGGAS